MLIHGFDCIISKILGIAKYGGCLFVGFADDIVRTLVKPLILSFQFLFQRSYFSLVILDLSLFPLKGNPGVFKI